MTIVPSQKVEIRAISGVPIVEAGANLPALILMALAHSRTVLASGDVLVVASKLVSRAENRFVDLSRITPSSDAENLGNRLDKDPRLLEVILRETDFISRIGPGALIVKNRLGIIGANAGVDQSNARPAAAPVGSGPWVLLLPKAPDESARAIRHAVGAATRKDVGVVISDSIGRPFRLGTVGIAIGLAGIPALQSYENRKDLFGRPLEHTVVATADQIATAADLVAGQGAEQTGVVLVRGLRLKPSRDGARALQRDADLDLYAHRTKVDS